MCTLSTKCTHLSRLDSLKYLLFLDLLVHRFLLLVQLLMHPVVPSAPSDPAVQEDLLTSNYTQCLPNLFTCVFCMYRKTLHFLVIISVCMYLLCPVFRCCPEAQLVLHLPSALFDLSRHHFHQCHLFHLIQLIQGYPSMIM